MWPARRATAHCMPVTNAVPYVVAAEPGIVTLKDLPPITGRVSGARG